MTRRLPARAIRFEYRSDMDVCWTPRFPELAMMANSVSLAMPYVEPYVIASTRAAAEHLDAPTREAAEAYVAQEARHHVQHRRFNALLRARYPGTTRVEGWMAATYGWLQRSRSVRFNAAFAAGFEIIAYSAARWIEPQVDELFAGAHSEAANLFLWHLAEEVEHKGVAFDVHRAVGGSRITYATAMLCALIILGWFTMLGAVVILGRERRLLNPLSWLRITRWLLSFLFSAGPVMMASAGRRFHPSSLVDPPRLTAWLTEYDDSTGLLPVFDTGFNRMAA